MHERNGRRIAAVTVALIAALTWANAASAAGAVNISSRQTLSTPNTVYRLTANRNIEKGIATGSSYGSNYTFRGTNCQTANNENGPQG